MGSKIFISGIFHIAGLHGQSLGSIWVMSRFRSPCKKQTFTLGRWAISSMSLGHVFSSNVLTDERVSYTHVSPLVGNGLSKGNV